MDTEDQQRLMGICKPTHAKPQLYTHFFLQMKEIARDFGYNLLIHGSMNRDLDLVAIPWVNEPKSEIEMINALVDCLGGTLDRALIGTLPGGRNSYVINLNRGGYKKNAEGLIADPIEFIEDPQYYIDISVVGFQHLVIAELESKLAEMEKDRDHEMMEFAKFVNENYGSDGSMWHKYVPIGYQTSYYTIDELLQQFKSSRNHIK